MDKNNGKSLRERLRRDTRASHAKLDYVVSSLDIAVPSGFLAFIRMQAIALGSLAMHAKSAASSDVLKDLSERAKEDLLFFDAQADIPVVTMSPLHPLAIDYIVAGSRLGTQVLRKRWRMATDERVRQADAYFSAPSHTDVWTSFCAIAEKIPASGHIADRVVHDAERIFSLFENCARGSEIEVEITHA